MRYGYIDRVQIGLSRFTNAVIGGDFDQMLSSRTYQLKEKKLWGILYRIINFIFYQQEDHCKETYEWETTYRL